ncbi:unnamed protein product [Paramecium primaurelia]|uniref:Tetratricopeptide repeat protein n=1 Tax=Paramecium primaurelia TaxID=5886 RepID=A0A8S1LT51_PARPR|nr:unnamed protein product [Paramecium primaurelia]
MCKFGQFINYEAEYQNLDCKCLEILNDGKITGNEQCDYIAIQIIFYLIDVIYAYFHLMTFVILKLVITLINQKITVIECVEIELQYLIRCLFSFSLHRNYCKDQLLIEINQILYDILLFLSIIIHYSGCLLFWILSYFNLKILQWYDKALAINPQYLNSLHSKCDCLFSLGQFEQAIEWLDKALAINPQNIDSLNGKELCLQYLNN